MYNDYSERAFQLEHGGQWAKEKGCDTFAILNLIERSQFNKRRRKLFLFLEEVRTKLASRFLEFEDYFIVDSMPLEICKFARHRRIKICKNEFETAPSKGFCASQKQLVLRI